MAENLEIGPAEFEWLQTKLRLADFLPIRSFDDMKVQLPTLELRLYAAGEKIVSEGDTDTDIFIVFEGTVEVKRKRSVIGSKTVGRLSSGAVFGEVGFLVQSPRSATVSASGAAKVFRIGASDMERVVQRDPRFAQQLAALAKERQQKLKE
jgi:CRP-like cAMP-binding protein